MFRIREATREDNAALLRLEAQSPQGTGISIVIDRDDYLYRTQLYKHSKVMLAEEDDKLVGVMAYAIKEVLVNGDRERVALFYDLRGEVSYRRSMKRGLFRLWRAVLQQIEAAGASFMYGYVKTDNHDSMKVATKLGAERVASFDILSLPTLRGPVSQLDPHLDTLDQEVERLSSLVGARSLKPYDFSAPYLLGAQLGYLRGIFRIEHRGSMAQVSVWDLTGIYRSRVLKMPVPLQMLAHILNPLSTILPVPRIPRAGEQMKYLQLFDPVCRGDRGAKLLKTLIQQLRRVAYSDGIDILTMFVYIDDPLARIPNFFPKQTLHYNTMVRPLGKTELPQRPLYLDIRDI